MRALPIYRQVSSIPGGKRLFSAVVCRLAPYFGSISPQISVLEPGRVEVELKKRRKVTNHLGTIHAIAMCNAAEMAAGLLMEVSLAPDRRWIPAGMAVTYRSKAKTDVVAAADGSAVDWKATGEIDIPVTIRDLAGTVVCTATIIMNVKSKKLAAEVPQAA